MQYGLLFAHLASQGTIGTERVPPIDPAHLTSSSDEGVPLTRMLRHPPYGRGFVAAVNRSPLPRRPIVTAR